MHIFLCIGMCMSMCVCVSVYMCVCALIGVLYIFVFHCWLAEAIFSLRVNVKTFLLIFKKSQKQHLQHNMWES